MADPTRGDDSTMRVEGEPFLDSATRRPRRRCRRIVEPRQRYPRERADQCAWRGVHKREGPGLLTHRGSAIVKWLDERTLWLGIPVDREWDDQGTLPVLIRRAKQQRLEAIHGRVAGDAVLRPAPAFVDTKGVDRPWDGPQ